MNLKDRQKLKKLIRELSSIRGRHTELVSVYIPAGYDLNKIISHLLQEQGTASNIKDARTRNNVIDSLERMIRTLRLYKHTPENGLAIFSGNVSKNESKIDIQVTVFEPPEPLKVRIYRCDQTFVTDILQEIMGAREEFGLITMDKREATIGILRGTSIIVLDNMTSNVPGKIKAGGQCLTPDTLIQSADGDIFEINKTHNPHVLVGANVDQLSISNTAITDKWDTNKDVVYRITTTSPRIELECSKDHVFFVRENEIKEKAAEELKVGNFLLMPEQINVKSKEFHFNPIKYYNSFKLTEEGSKLIINTRKNLGLFQKELAKEVGLTQTSISILELRKEGISAIYLQRICNRLKINFEDFIKNYTKKDYDLKLPIKLDSELAQIIGYFLGDGNYEKERICFSEDRKEIVDYYHELCKDYFNANTNLKFRENKNYWQLRVYGKPLVRFLQNEFSELRENTLGYIPKKILESYNEIVASFLKGLFDAEGYPNKSRLSIGLGMNNKKLINQLQMLLLRFSILSSVEEYDNKQNPYTDNPRFTLSLSEKKSLELFEKNIGFTANDKSQDLRIIINSKSNSSRVRQILILGSKIRQMIEGEGLSLKLFPKVSGFFRDNRMISKQIFNKSILQIVKTINTQLYDKLKSIYDCNFLPVKISSIEVLHKATNMVDISTQKGNFIANCLLVHNSAARFSRLREGAAIEFYKRISERMNKEFLMKKDLKGIILGGPGPTKEEFQDYLNNELKKKLIAIQDITYTDESGLHHLVEKSTDVLAKEAVIEEKKIMQKFFETLGKEMDKVAYGMAEVRKALEFGAVDTLLVSEDLDEDVIEELEKKCEEYGTKLQLISNETREGKQLIDLGGIAALLRYAIS